MQTMVAPDEMHGPFYWAWDWLTDYDNLTDEWLMYCMGNEL